MLFHVLVSNRSTRFRQSWFYKLGLLFGVTIVYGSLSVLLFTVYLLLLQIMPGRKTLIT